MEFTLLMGNPGDGDELLITKVAGWPPHKDVITASTIYWVR